MVKITWTKLALNDLDSIYEFIAKDSENFAIKVVEKIISRVADLNKLPLLGRVVPEFNDVTVRELIEGNYRIVYRVMKTSLSILRVHHTSRLLKK